MPGDPHPLGHQRWIGFPDGTVRATYVDWPYPHPTVPYHVPGIDRFDYTRPYPPGEVTYVKDADLPKAPEERSRFRVAQNIIDPDNVGYLTLTLDLPGVIMHDETSELSVKYNKMALTVTSRRFDQNEEDLDEDCDLGTHMVTTDTYDLSDYSVTHVAATFKACVLTVSITYDPGDTEIEVPVKLK